MTHKFTRYEVDTLTHEEGAFGESFDRIFDRDLREQNKDRIARRARQNHIRRSIEDYADTRRMRKMLGDRDFE